MSLKIYTYPDNYRVWKALVAAQYNQIDIELPPFDFDKDLKTESFKAKNPLQKVPVLETPTGCIFESGAIARYVAKLRADSNLLGATFFQQGQVDQWIDFCNNEIEPARGIWLAPIFGYLAYNEKAYQEAKKELSNALTALNAYLLNNTFLVGNAVTLADIVIVCSLVDLFRMVMTAKFLAPFPNVVRWFNTCVNQPEFSKVVGKVEMAKEEAQPPKGDKAAKKAEKPAAAPAAAKPAAAPKKEEAKKEEEGGDDDDAPKMKPKSALDLLPESPMVMDVVKKMCFAIRPFDPEFFEKLWPMWDNSGYVFYTIDYNYNSDNKEYWKIGNTLGGFLQRSEAARKWALGTIQAAGPEDEDCSGPWYVTGCWMFRGQEVPKEMMEENPDAEYYTWTKQDVTTDAGKAKVKEYMFGETVNGQKVLDRRFFK